MQDMTLRQAQQDLATLRSNVARDKQLKHLQSFNIINKTPVVQEAPPPPPRESSQSFVSRFPYNILNNEPLPSERVSKSAPAPREVRPLVNYGPSRMRIRPVDILSNNYKDSHEEKEARDRAVMRQKALERYWQTHNFDPLRCEYYDGEKEEQYQHTVRIAQQIQGVAAKARLPPSIAMTEGQAYDIVAHVPRDPLKLGHLDLMSTRSIRWRNRAAVEAEQATRGDEAGEQRAVTALHRTRARRFEELSDPHGFNIISGQFTAQTNLQGAQVGRPATVWERVSRDLPLRSAPASMTGTLAWHEGMAQEE
jgi:hypothetical protein